MKFRTILLFENFVLTKMSYLTKFFFIQSLTLSSDKLSCALKSGSSTSRFAKVDALLPFWFWFHSVDIGIWTESAALLGRLLNIEFRKRKSIPPYALLPKEDLLFCFWVGNAE